MKLLYPGSSERTDCDRPAIVPPDTKTNTIIICALRVSASDAGIATQKKIRMGLLKSGVGSASAARNSNKNCSIDLGKCAARIKLTKFDWKAVEPELSGSLPRTWPSWGGMKRN